MPDMKQIPLSQMEEGESGRVIEIQGGRGLMNRLEAMGIRPGKKVTKLSSMFMRGPVTVQVGTSQIAIGFGMAGKIIIEPDK